MSILNAELLGSYNKHTVGFYIHVGKRLLDVLVLSDSQPPPLKVPLKKGSLERLVIVVRNLGENEERHGSVSIELDPYFGPDSDVVTGEKYQ